MTATDPSASTDLTAYAGGWDLDPALTTVTFHTRAMWVLPVKGTARASSGSGTVTEQGTVSGRLVTRR